MDITDKMLFEHAAEARNIWLSAIPSDDELPEFHCSKSFEKKIKKLLKEQRRTLRQKRTLRYLKQTVAAILAIAVLSFSGLMTVEAYRERVIEIVIHVFNELTHYHFASNNIDTNEIILPDVFFEYIPEGMQQTDDRTTKNNRRYILYEDSTSRFFEFTQRPISADGTYGTILDTEDATYEVDNINGNEAIFNSKDGNSSIVWTVDNIVYRLYGNIEIEELRLIAAKIKIIEN